MSKALHKSWPMVPIGDLLKRVSRPVDVLNDATYREIGIRSHCKGIFHKPPTTAAQIGSKRVFWVEPGCLILNIVFAWEQAVALTRDSEAGMIASHRFPMYTSRNGMLLPEYAWYYFSTPRGKYDLGIASPGGAGRNKTLGQEEFMRLKFPVPPIDHQWKVVETVATADRAIERTSQLISTRRKLREGLSQQLLTGQRRLPRFSKPWETIRLKDIAKFIKGQSYTTAEYSEDDGDTYFITLKSIGKGGGYRPDGVKYFRGTVDRSRKVRAGDLIFANTDLTRDGKIVGAPIFLAALPSDEALISMDLTKVDVKPKFSKKFVYHVLRTYSARKFMIARASGSTVLHLDVRGAGKLPIDIPRSLDEQGHIATVLDAADREIALLEKKLAALRELKRGLTQKLLSAKYWRGQGGYQ